jgi:hypothetical protein
VASPQSPQLGYNHNIPHRGRLYHVQTEDSGAGKAHIFTHVFYDGTIVASNKVDYSERREEADLGIAVVSLMKDSHKAIIRQLRNGAFDEKIITVIGEHPAESNKAEAEVAPPEPTAERPERRPVPKPRDVAQQGPPLEPGEAGPTVDPSLAHPVFASQEARAQVAAAAARGGEGPARGPGRRRRRAIAGIGGEGVTAGSPVPISQRRDIIVGKFASDHQAELDDEILALLREEG